jgi:geranylgeranyl pyrophosphate synthase
MESLSAAEPIRRGLASPAGLPAVEATMARLAVGDHLDFCGEMVAEHLRTGGKRLRARLALAAAESLGLDRADVVPWAAACELLHNATLIHDDIQDGDRVRRDLPTTWAKYGVGQAINAGDLLLMLPFLALGQLECGPHARGALYAAVAEAAARTARGQAAEMALPDQDAVHWEDWDWAAEGKSGALLGLPVYGAAILAGLDQRTARGLAQPFSRAGVLYQLQDDLLDLTMAKGKGRIAADIHEGKVNAVVAAHLSLHPTERAETLTLLRAAAAGTAPESNIERLVNRLVDGGAVAHVERQLALQARAILADPTLRAVPALLDLASELVHRVCGAANEATRTIHEKVA